MNKWLDLPMLCQPFCFLIEINVRILDGEVKNEGLIRCDDDLPIHWVNSGDKGREGKDLTSFSRIADKLFSFVLL